MTGEETEFTASGAPIGESGAATPSSATWRPGAHPPPVLTGASRWPVFQLRSLPANGAAPCATGEPGRQANALLAEVLARALRFSQTGETAAIDLRCTISMPDERRMLLSLLGTGEVSVRIDSLGLTEIRETAIPCVWWICHRDRDGETIGEAIEINDVPDLMLGDRMAIAAAIEVLRTGWPCRESGADIATPISQAR